MISITLLNVTAYSIGFSLVYYIGACIFVKRIIPIDLKKLIFYISLFCLFGVAGEVLVNNIYAHLFSIPLWEYRLFPAHDKDVSYFFLFVWGALGYYKYINDTAIHRFAPTRHILPGLIMGAEAIVLEVLYNGLFLLFFGSYIFYYFPDNLGFFSHLSCLQVIPFYFLVGLSTTALVNNQNKIGYGKNLLITLPFYWMIILALVLF